jgi:hypothetical protein
MTMKFEMHFGYFRDTITLETEDFDVVKTFYDFIKFQEEHEWDVKYKAVKSLRKQVKTDI